MKQIGKRTLAVLCMLVLIGGMVLPGNVFRVQASDVSASVRETKVVPYESAVPGTAPIDVPEGYVFAGWFQKNDCVDALTVSGNGYAKFVDERILGVKAQITGSATTLNEAVDIRFVTTVDTLKYRKVGFDITISGKTKTVSSKDVYTTLYAVGTTGETLSMTPSSSFCQLSNYFNTFTVYNVPNLSFGSVISARPYWITQDGTQVYGELAKKTINMGIFQTEAVDYGIVLDCDNKNYLMSDSGVVNVDITDYKEGAAALKLMCTESDTTLVQFNRGKQSVDISDYTDGYLHFWFYIQDVNDLNGSSVIAELSSSGAKDAEEVQWTLSTLVNGWNEVSLAFADATATGKIDYEAIDYFSLKLTDACNTGLVIKLDDVRAVASGQIFDCDSLEYSDVGNNAVTLTTDDYKEGTAAIRSAGTENTRYEFVRATSPVDISSARRLCFWFYVNDLSYLGSQNLEVELGSDATSGSQSLQWDIAKTSLQSGWNEIALPLAAPDTETGSIDLTAVNYFRFSHTGASTKLVTIVDGVRAIENESQLIRTENTSYETKDVVIADFIPTEMGYAVDPTGQTDSTAGIQAALNDCFATGGGTVYLPAGTYKITDSINIPAFVTLRGDWQDPDTTDEGLTYGTIVSVEMNAVDATTAKQTGVFKLNTSSGAVGLTVYYPQQTLSDVKIYPYTFYVGENAKSILGGTYETAILLPTVREVTVINGYRGIGATTIEAHGTHNSLQIENFKGTFLECGVELYHSSDVGTVQSVDINNSYWLEYDSLIDKTTLDSYTKANTVGMRLGDVEWTEYVDICINTCKIGIQTVKGVREGQQQFVGSFYDLYITNCVTGLQVDSLDHRWGMNVARGEIAGDTYAVANKTDSYVQLCDVDVRGTIWEPFQKDIVTSDTTISGRSWTKTNCGITIDTSKYSKDNLKLCVTMTIPEGVYNTIKNYSSNAYIKIKFGTSTQYYMWGIDRTTQMAQGKKTYILNLSKANTAPLLGAPNLSNTLNYVNFTEENDLSLAGVIIHDIKLADMNGEVVIDSTDLSTKTIDYTKSYVKPAERMVIAKLTEETVSRVEDLTLSMTVNINDTLYQAMTANGGNLYIEVAEVTKDTKEYSWSIVSSSTDLHSGTCVITRSFSEAKPTKDGAPNMNDVLDWFRIYYTDKSGAVVSLANGLTIHEVKVVDHTADTTKEWYILNKDTAVTTDTYSNNDIDLWLEKRDASSKLQRYLDWMAKAGGGVVYIPGGTYSFYQPITVPEGVELRGSSSVATRDEFEVCEGTLFLCYYNDNGKGMNDTAFITLDGENAGVNGIRITYANNGPYITDTNTSLSTSYAIRGTATGVYVVNSMISAAAYGVDFRNCDNHYVRGVHATCYYTTFCLGGTGGTVAACLQNPTVELRTDAPVSDTWGDVTKGMFPLLLYKTIKMYSHYIVLVDTENEAIYNNFSYGSMTMLTNIDSKNTTAVNIGTDNSGASSAQIVMDGGSLTGVNILRYAPKADTFAKEEGQYLPNGVESQGYKYIAGDLELHNRLRLVPDLDAGEKNEAPVVKKGTESKKDTKKTVWNGPTSTTGSGVIRFNAYMDKPVNIADFADGQLCLRLYINDKSNLTSSNAFYVEIGSSRRCDCEELQWAIPVSELKTGWNTIVLDMGDAASTGFIHLGAIDFIRIYHDGNSDALETIIDNIYATSLELNFKQEEDDYIWSEWL